MSIKCPKCRTENPETQRFCGDCGTHLTPFGKPEISVTRTIETSVEELGRGTIFAGRYEIVEELGTGGMGKVYRAFDKKLQEDVAIKLIRPDVAANRKTVERFHNEIRIARKITHKNVCRTHDLHEEGKTLFLTMEFVRGEDLRSLIHRMKVLPIGTAVFIARQIAEGLSEAHKLGIVHRDLKPGNIMIDKDGQAKIMDFGIARSLVGKGLTGEGAIVGTPEYMSPEQVEGKEADQRSDIYSLGIILYEMLIGRPPFEGETPFSIANKHKTEPPPVPKKIIPQIPEELNKLILRCLEKDKSKRYQTAEELVADLSAVELTLPSTDRALTQARTKIRTSREITLKLTPRKLLLPSAIVIVVAIALVSVLVLFKPQAGKINSLAVLPLEDLSTMKGTGYGIAGIHESLITALSKIPSVNVLARQNVLRFAGSKLTYSEIARELKVDALVHGSVMQEGDDIRITVGMLDGRNNRQIWGPVPFDRKRSEILILYDEVTLAIAREINAQMSARDLPNLARKRNVNPKAYELYQKTRASYDLTGPETSLSQSLEDAKRCVEMDSKFALGYVMLARIYTQMGFLGLLPIDEVRRIAKEAALTALSLDEASAEAHAALGRVYFMYEWDLKSAETEYKKAMALGSSEFRGQIIEYLTLVKRFDEALGLHNRSIQADPLRPDYANLGWILYMAGRFDEAIAAMDKALKLNLDDRYIRSLRSLCYAHNKMCTQALAESDKMLDEIQPALRDPKTLLPEVDYLLTMGVNYAMCGKRGKAEAVISIIKSIPDLPAGSVGLIYAWLGEKDLAINDLAKMVEDRQPASIYLYADPETAPLRNDPRFTALLKKVGFEK